jgi:hypothetical protein
MKEEKKKGPASGPVDTGISKKKNGGAGKGRFLEGLQNF